MDATVFEALGDERRLKIIELLASGEQCVCRVSEELGISDALASHHLKKLRAAGLVRTRRRGSWLYCSLDSSALDMLAEDLRGMSARACAAPSNCCGMPGTDEEVATDG